MDIREILEITENEDASNPEEIIKNLKYRNGLLGCELEKENYRKE